MSIDDGFKTLLEGVKLADDGRDEIMRGLEDAWAGRKDLDSQMGDLRDSIASLEALIVEQGQKLDTQGTELRALRAAMKGDRP